MAVVVIDLVILMELTGCLYWSGRYGEDAAPMFLYTYLPTILATIIIGRICISRLRSKA